MFGYMPAMIPARPLHMDIGVKRWRAKYSSAAAREQVGALPPTSNWAGKRTTFVCVAKARGRGGRTSVQQQAETTDWYAFRQSVLLLQSFSHQRKHEGRYSLSYSSEIITMIAGTRQSSVNYNCGSSYITNPASAGRYPYSSCRRLSSPGIFHLTSKK